MNGMDLPFNDRADPPLIALGILDDGEKVAKERGANVWATLLLSLSVHLGIGWWLIATAGDKILAPWPEVEKVVLRLVPSNPQVSDAPTAGPVEQEIVDPAVEALSEPSAPTVPPVPAVSPAPIVEVPVIRDSSPVPNPSRPVPTPSTLTLRQVVEDTLSRQEQQNPGFHCSPLQLENDMLNCSNRLDERFENIPESNATVEFFSRSVTPSRLQNAARMTDAGVAQIGANLRAAGINDASIGRLMNQLESIAREYAAPQNQKTQTLQNEMLRADPVWQQRNRAMNPR